MADRRVSCSDGRRAFTAASVHRPGWADEWVGNCGNQTVRLASRTSNPLKVQHRRRCYATARPFSLTPNDRDRPPACQRSIRLSTRSLEPKIRGWKKPVFRYHIFYQGDGGKRSPLLRDGSSSTEGRGSKQAAAKAHGTGSFQLKERPNSRKNTKRERSSLEIHLA